MTIFRARMSNSWISSGWANHWSAFCTSAAATFPFKWACLPLSVAAVSKIPNSVSDFWYANHWRVRGSFRTSDKALRRNSLTVSAWSGFATRGTCRPRVAFTAVDTGRTIAAKISILSISGPEVRRVGAFATRAAATLPFKCASRPIVVGKVSKIAYSVSLNLTPYL